MPPARRRTNADRIAAALQWLEEAERALLTIDEGRLSHEGKEAVNRLRNAIKDGKSAAGDSLEASLGGSLTRAPLRPEPLFSDRSEA